MPPDKPGVDDFPIVAVGASAGGFEALSILLSKLPPNTGMAYIIVQHLDPNHESIAAELLGRKASIPVFDASDGLKISPNTAYVLPPNHMMTVADGHLSLAPRGPAPGRYLPIDHFMRSLAEIHGRRAIGVVLSGMANDGTNGLRAIKAEGGLTLAQNPANAKFDAMPRSAIASGCVDNVMDVEQIAAELARISRHPYVALPAAVEGEPEITEPSEQEDLDNIFGLLKKATGVDFKLYKHTTIHRRIARRMVVHKVESMREYLKLLQEQQGEIEALYQDLLIKVTRFFRDPEVFDFLKSRVFPSIVDNRANDSTIRVWVPGCATGEEVYSIAICLLEYIGDMAANPSVQIFATDVSELAIQTARDGRYQDNIAMDVSPERLRRFFVHVDGGYQISKPIRDLCIFARQNMTSDPPFSKLDLISCRNVLIYLDARLQKRVIPLFHYALKHNGCLMLGSSETIGPFADLFSLIDKKHKIYVRKDAPTRMHVDFSTAYAGELMEAVRPTRETIPDENWRVHDAQRDADRIILSRYSAAGVVVNQDMDVIQFRGDTSPFLQHPPGEPSLNLLKLARNGLALELRSLLHEVRKGGGTIVKENVPLGDNERLVRLEISPLQVPASRASFFLVLFELQRSATEKDNNDVPAPPPETIDVSSRNLQRRIDQLSAELSATKHHLQSIIEEQEATNEELQSANEEVLSSNEELQSINEELETAKEELQSTNEELTTVNEELQTRNIELSHVNNDLTNLLSSVNIPIIMLGSDLRIRRFTPQAEKLFSLIPTDVGRPIGDIKPRIDLPDLETLVAEVIDSVTVRELEVKDKDGRWHSMRVRPYKTRENKIDGAVIALVDIDVIRKRQRKK